MIFGLEVVEEGSFAHVRGFGNVFDRNVGKAALGNELQGAAEEPQARFAGAALAASHAWGWGGPGAAAGLSGAGGFRG